MRWLGGKKSQSKTFNSEAELRAAEQDGEQQQQQPSSGSRDSLSPQQLKAESERIKRYSAPPPPPPLAITSIPKSYSAEFTSPVQPFSQRGRGGSMNDVMMTPPSGGLTERGRSGVSPVHTSASSIAVWLQHALEEVERYKFPDPPLTDKDFRSSLRFPLAFDAQCQVYAPAAFAEMRRLLLPPNFDICDSLWMEAGRSAGKSGSSFARTECGTLLAKSVADGEFESLKRILPDLFYHVQRRPETLLNIPVGLFVVERTNQKKEHIICIPNLLPPSGIAMVFDLKGSTQGRSASAEEKKKALPTLKDNEWRVMDLKLQAEKAEDLVSLRLQLHADVSLLERHRLMDYSLLVGIMLKAPRDRHPDDLRRNILRGTNGKAYYVGVIDFLSLYGTAKKMASALKSITADKDTISSVPPDQYANRFLRFYDEFISRSESPDIPTSPTALIRAQAALGTPWRLAPKAEAVVVANAPERPRKGEKEVESGCSCVVM
eukprot:Hpha_TRINITY_DN3752_c0_g1::TRINITY_DN3752_c0_g1_i1::g.23792::m.23792/K00889/PIP5K; 1-phosphatidylinositol-4-phosphate 5-kinase